MGARRDSWRAVGQKLGRGTPGTPCDADGHPDPVGFLLILPFQSRFEELTADLLTIYLCAVLFGTLAIALIVAPVTAHRIFFRLLVKDRLVLWGDRMAKAGLFCFAVTVGLVVALVIGFLLGISTGIIAGIVAFLVFALLWVVLPLMVVRRTEGPE